MDQKQQYIISATQLPRLYLLSLFCFIPSSESKNKFQKLFDKLRTLTEWGFKASFYIYSKVSQKSDSGDNYKYPHTWISNRKCHSMLRIELRIANSFESRLTDPYWWINNAKASLDQMEKQTRCCKCFLLAGGQGERGAPAPYIEKGKIGSRRCYIEKDKTEPFPIATTRV